MKHAVIKNNEVINIILWDGIKPVTFPDDVTVVQSDTLAIGMKYDGDKWYMPITPYVEPKVSAQEFMNIITDGKEMTYSEAVKLRETMDKASITVKEINE